LVLVGVLMLGLLVAARLFSDRVRLPRFLSAPDAVPPSGAVLSPAARTNGNQSAAHDRANGGSMPEQQRDLANPEAAYRPADERGDANGAFNLAVLLEERGDLAGAEAAYHRADERDHAAAAANLGVLLEDQGDLAGAEAAFRRADERGDANGAFNLGVLLEEQRDLAGAEAAYHRAGEHGNAKVAQMARAALRDLGGGVLTSVSGHNGAAHQNGAAHHGA
jgi:tetratricopeptide (TPR) repeat protein